MSNWSKRRRLEATIAGEQADRPPVALWKHWPGDDQDAEALAAASLKWQQDYDWDLLKIGPSSGYSVNDWGVKDRWVGHIEGTREYTHRPIQRVADWANLEPLDPKKGVLAEQIETLQRVGTAVNDNAPFIATIFSPLSQAKKLATHEGLVLALRSQPDLFHQALEVMTESTLRFIQAAKTTGISGIYYAVQHNRYQLLSRAEYSEFGRPYDLRILEAAQDLWLNVLHVHSTDIMFDLVADLPAQIVNWHDRETGFTLAEGLKQIKGAASGGIDHWTLHQESPEDMLAEAQDAIEQVNGRRLMLGTGCVAMVTTPTRNIRALREFVGK